MSCSHPWLVLDLFTTMAPESPAPWSEMSSVMAHFVLQCVIKIILSDAECTLQSLWQADIVINPIPRPPIFPNVSSSFVIFKKRTFEIAFMCVDFVFRIWATLSGIFGDAFYVYMHIYIYIILSFCRGSVSCLHVICNMRCFLQRVLWRKLMRPCTLCVIQVEEIGCSPVKGSTPSHLRWHTLVLSVINKNMLL